MKKPTKRTRPLYFTDEQKHTIIHAYLTSGKTKEEIWRAYTGKTDHGVLLRWMRKFGYVEPDLDHPSTVLPNLDIMTTLKNQQHQPIPATQATALNQRIKELEKQLEQAQLRAVAYETMVELAEKELGIPIRKKYATKPSKS